MRTRSIAKGARWCGAGRFPFVYGGECSRRCCIVTGTLRDHVAIVGMVFIDGHEEPAS